MVTRKPVEDSPPEPEALAVEPRMLTAVVQAGAIGNVFARRSAAKAPTLADYEGSDKWPL